MRAALPFFALTLLLMADLARSQTTEFVPDSTATAGTCNSIPLGTALGPAATYVGRIPASFLANALAAGDQMLSDVAVAPCGSGTWTASSVVFGVGHLPAALPTPFVFPDPSTPGTFTDFTVLWDSAIHGPFSFAAVQDQWSSLGGGAPGTAAFIWNGMDDVGVFLTHDQPSITSAAGWGGTCHRTNTEPFRFYASGFYAPSSTGTGASGLKMRLTFDPGVGITPMLLQVVAAPNGNVFFGVTNVPAPTTFGWMLPSSTPQFPTGSGPNNGILADILTFDVYGAFFAYPAPGHPFHWSWPVPSNAFPSAPLQVPAIVAANFTGMSWDWAVLAFGSGGLITQSNVVNYTW